MDAVFSKILSMSLSACFVIAAVLLLRILLRKAPKKYSYFLWLLVFFRLLCPFTPESAFSLVPVNEDAIVYQSSIGSSALKVETVIQHLDQISAAAMERVNQSATTVTEDSDPITAAGTGSSLTNILMILWITGVLALAGVGILQVLRLKLKLRTAVLVSAGTKDCCAVYESEYIHTAFLLGFFRPCIYLPPGIEEERGYVIAHEMMHKKRRDYLVKPVCYLAVILHWFNPLVWLSFYFMTKDMEMSCDEQVLKSAIEDIRGAYSRSLLNLSIKGSGLAIPLAFGETNTKERIKHALSYKKPSTWIGMGAIVVILIAAVTLLTNNPEIGNSGTDGNDAEKNFYHQLSENRNLYIGDASANGRLMRLLLRLNCYESRGMELKTTGEPYELKWNFEKTDPITYREEQENADTMWRNAIFLFATIENMDICTFVLDDTEEVVETSYTREEMEEIFGELYPKSETPEGLKELEQEMKDYKAKMQELLSSVAEVEPDMP